MAMAKAKKRLSKALAAVFTAFTLLSMAPAALAAGPINENKPTVKAGADLQINAQTKAEYKIGERIDFYVQAPNVAGLVEYRVAVWSKMTGMRDLFQDKASKAKGYWYQPWKTAGTYERRITWVASGDNWPEGDYQLVAYVRRNGQTKFEDVEEVGTFKLVKDAPVAEAKVESVTNPADVTVNVGDKFTAPTTVKATMSDKTTKDVAVTWENTVDTSKAGDVTLTGKAADKAVSMKVSVKEVALKVDSVAAKTASTFEVKFNRAVADTTKVAFDVKRETTAYAMTASWNADKTVATLTGSAKFPLGSYSVNVKNDATDLGTTSLKIEQEKVAKILLTSDTLAVVNVDDDNNALTPDVQRGYFTYKVENQYGEDITASSIPSITWTIGGGTGVANKGTVTVTPSTGINLLNLPSLVVTAIDNNANVVSSSNLKVSFTNSTLSDIKLIGLKQVDGKVLTADDTATKFTVDFEARDMGGNLTQDYDIITNGLSTINLSPSDYVTYNLVRGDNNKASLEIRALSKTAAIDMPVVLTVITKNGKSSTLNLTLKKQAEVNTVTLMQPTTDVAFGDNAIEIPFVAYDQDGKQITKYDDLASSQTVGKNFTLSSPLAGSPSTGMYFVKKADGTAKLMYKPEGVSTPAQTQDKSVVLSVTTQTGKFSSITLNVRTAKKASTLSVASDLMSNLEQGADYRVLTSKFTVKDQYGRKMDVGANAKIKATVLGSGVTTNNVIDTGVAGATNDIHIIAGASAEGTVSVLFTLLDGSNVELDSRTVDFRVVKPTAIKGLVTSDVSLAHNDFNESSAVKTAKVYTQNIDVYGVLDNGTKVVLATKAFDITTSNSSASAVDQGDNTVDLAVRVNKSADADKTTTTIANITTVIGGEVRVASVTIKSDVAGSVAKSVVLSADEYSTTSTSLIKDKITIEDQYGVNLMEKWLADPTVSDVKVYFNDASASTTTLVTSGTFTDFASLASGLSAVAGDKITIVTSNGLTASFMFK